MDGTMLENDFAFLESAYASDIGRRRKRNEDSVASLHERGVFCVADGMGGEDAGDVASQAVVRGVNEAMAGEIPRNDILRVEDKCRRLDRALHESSEWIRKRAEAAGRGMSGSTVVLLAFDAVEPRAAVALHAGDSRLYRLRDEELTQITRDHSMAEESGMSKSQLPKIFRGMVTRAVGIQENIEIARTEVDVREGDLFLLCSDGLSGMLPDRKIRRLLLKNQSESLGETVAALVTAANDAGGEDNVSVIAVRVGALPASPPDGEGGEQEEDETRTDPRALATAAAAALAEKETEEDETERETADTLPLPAAGGGEGKETAETVRRPAGKCAPLARLFRRRCHS